MKKPETDVYPLIRPQDVDAQLAEFVFFILPRRDPGDPPCWTWTSGQFTTVIEPGLNWNSSNNGKWKCDYPYGAIPRLLLAWMANEAARGSDRLQLHTLHSFMQTLGAEASQAQMDSLFGATLTLTHGNLYLTTKIVAEYSYRRDHDENILWGSWIRLGKYFYKALVDFEAAPDRRVLRDIKDSPLALDLYAVLNRELHRARQNGEPRFLAWEQVHRLIGADHADVRALRRQCLPHLDAILAVDSGLVVSHQRGSRGRPSGLLVGPE